ncbi:MAG: hypothetical protein E2O29_02165 [Deltaproteobacteria bacterium]|nr:MAG: hypothetical protein E2O29_02165 [Deltaproteobacteria bacterium]
MSLYQQPLDKKLLTNRYFFYLKVGKIAKTVFADHPILGFVLLFLVYRYLKKIGFDFKQLKELGGKILQVHKRINAIVVEFPTYLSEKQILRISNSLNVEIEQVVEVHTMMNKAVNQCGAFNLHGAGYEGEGVKVAIIDTGINDNHPSLKGKVVARQDFTGKSYFPLFNQIKNKLYPRKLDEVGHGTHCAGIVASNDSTYKGVAPKVALIDAKVLAASGRNTTDRIIRGMSWAASQGADVISMSLGGGGHANDAMSREANRLAEEGIVVVVAAGNEGPRPDTISSPGVAEKVITVGSVDQINRIPTYSSRGPVIDRNRNLSKPDVVAPGGGIKAEHGCPYGDGITSVKTADQKVDKCTVVDSNNTMFQKMSGTSMATPHVAGAAALLIEAAKLPKSRNRGEKVKMFLRATAKGIGYADREQGRGIIDIPAAVKLANGGKNV